MKRDSIRLGPAPPCFEISCFETRIEGEEREREEVEFVAAIYHDLPFIERHGTRENLSTILECLGDASYYLFLPSFGYKYRLGPTVYHINAPEARHSFEFSSFSSL